MVSFIDDIAVILPQEISLDMSNIGKVEEWLQGRLGVEDISLNRRKSQAREAYGEERHRAHGDPTVDKGSGSTFGTKQFKQGFF